MFRLLNRLAVSQKLALISIFFILPDSVMLTLMISNVNENINFSELEVKGNSYLRPLEKLLHWIPQHQQLLVQYRENTSKKPFAQKTLLEQIQHFQGKIDQSIDNLLAVDKQYGVDLQFTEEGLNKRNRSHLGALKLQAKWSHQKALFYPGSPDLSDQSYESLILDIRAMITHAGDTSNLILDPDLDSYYLMDATLLALPQTQDRLAKITT